MRTAAGILYGARMRVLAIGACSRDTAVKLTDLHTSNQSSSIVCVMTPCSLVGGYPRFGLTYFRQLQGNKGIYLQNLTDYTASQPTHKTVCTAVRTLSVALNGAVINELEGMWKETGMR
jgi:hypothetical protein